MTRTGPGLSGYPSQYRKAGPITSLWVTSILESLSSSAFRRSLKSLNTSSRTKRARRAARINFSGVDIERAMEYSCEDADITLRLVSILDKKLKEDMNQDLFYNLEMRLLPVLKDMELAGIRIDIPFFETMSRDFAKEIKELKGKIYAEAGMEFNINSPKQMGLVLFEQ